MARSVRRPPGFCRPFGVSGGRHRALLMEGIKPGVSKSINWTHRNVPYRGRASRRIVQRNRHSPALWTAASPDHPVLPKHRAKARRSEHFRRGVRQRRVINALDEVLASDAVGERRAKISAYRSVLSMAINAAQVDKATVPVGEFLERWCQKPRAWPVGPASMRRQFLPSGGARGMAEKWY